MEEAIHGHESIATDAKFPVNFEKKVKFIFPHERRRVRWHTETNSVSTQTSAFLAKTICSFENKNPCSVQCFKLIYYLLLTICASITYMMHTVGINPYLAKCRQFSIKYMEYNYYYLNLRHLIYRRAVTTRCLVLFGQAFVVFTCHYHSFAICKVPYDVRMYYTQTHWYVKKTFSSEWFSVGIKTHTIHNTHVFNWFIFIIISKSFDILKLKLMDDAIFFVTMECGRNHLVYKSTSFMLQIDKTKLCFDLDSRAHSECSSIIFQYCVVCVVSDVGCSM